MAVEFTISAYPTSGPPPLAVTVTIRFSGVEPYSDHLVVVWWGDGYANYLYGMRADETGSKTYSTEHTYKSEGSYTIKAELHEGNRLDTPIIAEAYASVTVTEEAPPPSLKVELYLPDRATRSEYVTATIVISGTPIGPGYVTGVIDWGDGQRTTKQFYIGLNETSGTFYVKHQYFTTGIMTVSITVTDWEGNTASDSATIAIEEPPPPKLVIEVMQAYPSSGYAPLDVNVYVEWTGGKVPYAVTIDFGDGERYTETGISGGVDWLAVMHTYTKAGTYTVKATVSDAAGQSKSATATVTVEEAPPAMHRVSMQVASGSGKICVDGHCTTSYTATSITEGTTVTVTATPDTGYALEKVVVITSEKTMTKYEKSFTITITSATDIYAYFKPKTGTYRIGVNIKSAGIPPLNISAQITGPDISKTTSLTAYSTGEKELWTLTLTKGYTYKVTATATDRAGRTTKDEKSFTA